MVFQNRSWTHLHPTNIPISYGRLLCLEKEGIVLAIKQKKTIEENIILDWIRASRTRDVDDGDVSSASTTICVLSSGSEHLYEKKYCKDTGLRRRNRTWRRLSWWLERTTKKWKYWWYLTRSVPAVFLRYMLTLEVCMLWNSIWPVIALALVARVAKLGVSLKWTPPII